jgi:hypothetical protein
MPMTTCKNINNVLNLNTLYKPIATFPFRADGGVVAELYDSARGLNGEWTACLSEGHAFLGVKYLCALEEANPLNMRFNYLIFKRLGTPIGIAYFQLTHFNAKESIKIQAAEDPNCRWTALSNCLKGLVASHVDFDALVCGNLLVTGENGYCFVDGVETPQQVGYIDWAIDTLMGYHQAKGEAFSVALIKDVFEPLPLQTAKFYEFCVQPNMILHLPPHWKTFDDYLQDLHAKYRTRAKRAFSKGKEIEFRELTINEIKDNNDWIYQLFRRVADKASFNIVKLHPDYFVQLKTHLGDNFKMMGVFENGQMIGFYTLVLRGSEMEAHFLGYDDAYNKEHQVYLNMLFDMIRQGIQHQVKQINFERTALEIKSSVGAVAVPMYCYLRHRNSLSNRFLGSMFEYLNTPIVWEPRHPFKNSHDKMD